MALETRWYVKDLAGVPGQITVIAFALTVLGQERSKNRKDYKISQISVRNLKGSADILSKYPCNTFHLIGIAIDHRYLLSTKSFSFDSTD